MKNFETTTKRESLDKRTTVKIATDACIQPFKETPSTNSLTEHKSAARINAHDLFSLYTADIIKEDVLFIR